MVHIINISRARANLAKIVSKVRETKQPVVIVQDSIPSVILQPYEDTTIDEAYLKKLLAIKGDWFSIKEYKKMRKEVEEKLKRNSL